MKAKSGPTRIMLTLRSLLFMGALGGGLIVYNLVTSRRDVALALGGKSDAQESFFVGDADRPDIGIFYRKLTDPQKIVMAQNIGLYSDPELAKLCAILLGDFSAAARAALTESLTEVGRVHPDAVALQLGKAGSFEQVGVREALRQLGTSAFPGILKTLSDEKMRPNAEELLVSEGPSAIPPILPLLNDENPKIRVSAATILGKLRARQANGRITTLYEGAQGADRQAYLTALSTIADPSSEASLSEVLADSGSNSDLRTQAALGLGRIASETSIKTLWKFAQSPDWAIREGSMSGLLLGKDRSLGQIEAPESLRLRVAAGIISPNADKVIRTDLATPSLRLAALSAAMGRASLVPDLARFLAQKANQENGELADQAVKSLLSTDSGKVVLRHFSAEPLLEGFIKRQEILKAG